MVEGGYLWMSLRSMLNKNIVNMVWKVCSEFGFIFFFFFFPLLFSFRVIAPVGSLKQVFNNCYTKFVEIILLSYMSSSSIKISKTIIFAIPKSRLIFTLSSISQWFSLNILRCYVCLLPSRTRIGFLQIHGHF